MKWFIAIFGLALCGQTLSVEKERALGDALRRDAKPFANAEVAAYVARMGGEVIDSDRVTPTGLPGGGVLVPVGAILASSTEAELLKKIGHAIGHIALRHGYLDRNVVIVDLHPESGVLPGGVARRMPQFESAAERYGAEYANRAESNEQEFQRVREIVRTALAAPVRKAPSLR